MEDSAQLTDPNEPSDTNHQQHHHHHHRHHYRHHHHYYHYQQRPPHQRGEMPVGEIGDDESSTDSGCSSDSTGNGKRLSRRGSDERLCSSSRSSPKRYYYLDRLRRRPTRSSERPSGSVQRSSERTCSSPEDVTNLHRGGVSLSSYSSSPSDAHSSSDSDSLKKPSTTETLRRAFRNLNITFTSKRESNKEKKHAKKSPKRILRSPVPYMYVRGLSGLPTQRIPRNLGLQQQSMQFYSCQDLIGYYR